MTDQTKDGISKNSTLVIDVPQGITTNNFRTVTSNNTYQLSTLYQGLDNPVAFKPNSEIEIRVPQTSLDITQISNYPITQNNTTINIPIPSGYDAVDSISVDVQVPTMSIPEYNINLFKFYENNSELTGFLNNNGSNSVADDVYLVIQCVDQKIITISIYRTDKMYGVCYYKALSKPEYLSNYNTNYPTTDYFYNLTYNNIYNDYSDLGCLSYAPSSSVSLKTYWCTLMNNTKQSVLLGNLINTPIDNNQS